ncbi:hypothetical protein [Actinomadura fibrosa]|uniref:Uncharacterized protein n=1 Tax=Actinomadura fibrosa TaxID=111802 RepID=A0ABW2XRJ0_9ACTN|nr:hypothetical protein [Actinomadura fibrosa]
MRIPKRVNAVLDWMEKHSGALGAVVALVAVALVATLAPPLVGFPIAGFIIGLAVGGFLVHVRMSRRVARVRAEVDDLLRENGALRHRNTVLASGVITRGAQETQTFVAIPEDDDDLAEDDPTSTAALPELPDDLTGTTTDLSEVVTDVPEETTGLPEATTDLPRLPGTTDELPGSLEALLDEEDEGTAKNHRKR